MKGRANNHHLLSLILWGVLILGMIGCREEGSGGDDGDEQHEENDDRDEHSTLCGEPGSRTHDVDGQCECEPGYEWEDHDNMICRLIDSECDPECDGRECGPDPECGQSCGDCVVGVCTEDGQCSVSHDPTPADDGLCYGTANVEGDVPARFAVTRLDGGGIGLILHDSNDTFEDGDQLWILRLMAIPGEYSYPPTSGLAQCGVIEYRDDEFVAVSAIDACEIALSELRFSESSSLCDGYVEGIFQGFLAGGGFVVGSFSSSMVIMESDLASGCRPYDAPCGYDDECCSGNCMVWGTCA